jgi:hypothetical protein
MDKKENGHLGVHQEAVEMKRDNDNSTTANGDRLREIDPVRGWYGLAAGVKPSRTRQQKRGWNRSTK